MAAPHELVMDLGTAWLRSRRQHTVAHQGVADALDDTPRTPAALAQETGADPAALERVLRLLAAHGVFALRDGRVSHTPASRLLRSDHPRSLRPFARMMGLPIDQTAYCTFERSLRTGRPAIESLAPGGAFAYLAEHPAEAEVFNAAMTAKAHGQVAAVLGAYDFSGFGTIADIGGGRGHLLRAILERAPSAKGILFDLPRVIREAEPLASDRLTLEAGDFFRDPLPAADAYVLMDVIHDWDDARSAAILGAVRAAARPSSRVLLIEHIVPEHEAPAWAKTLDVLMLLVTGGLQRSVAQFEALFASTGFRLARVVECGGDLAIVEGTPAAA
jgi:hypothetical protein